MAVRLPKNATNDSTTVLLLVNSLMYNTLDEHVELNALHKSTV